MLWKNHYFKITQVKSLIKGSFFVIVTAFDYGSNMITDNFYVVHEIAMSSMLC